MPMHMMDIDICFIFLDIWILYWTVTSILGNLKWHVTAKRAIEPLYWTAILPLLHDSTDQRGTLPTQELLDQNSTQLVQNVPHDPPHVPCNFRQMLEVRYYHRRFSTHFGHVPLSNLLVKGLVHFAKIYRLLYSEWASLFLTTRQHYP